MENPKGKTIALSLVIPCYNEGELIGESLRKIIDFLDTQDIAFEILVGDDGSTGNTIDTVKSMIQKDNRVRLLSQPMNKGKGAVLSSTFLHARNGILAFIDADLEIDVRYLTPLLEMVANGSDIAIGSKQLHGVHARGWKRKLATLGYNIFVRLLLNSRLSDHQAGIKVFKRDVLLDVLSDMSNNGWTWDTEVLVRAQKKGYIINEYPVCVNHRSGSNISIIKHSVQMAKDILIMYLGGLRITCDKSGKVICRTYKE